MNSTFKNHYKIVNKETKFVLNALDSTKGQNEILKDQAILLIQQENALKKKNITRSAFQIEKSSVEGCYEIVAKETGYVL